MDSIKTLKELNEALSPANEARNPDVDAFNTLIVKIVESLAVTPRTFNSGMHDQDLFVLLRTIAAPLGIEIEDIISRARTAYQADYSIECQMFHPALPNKRVITTVSVLIGEPDNNGKPLSNTAISIRQEVYPMSSDRQMPGGLVSQTRREIRRWGTEMNRINPYAIDYAHLLTTIYAPKKKEKEPTQNPYKALRANLKRTKANAKGQTKPAIAAYIGRQYVEHLTGVMPNIFGMLYYKNNIRQLREKQPLSGMLNTSFMYTNKDGLLSLDQPYLIFKEAGTTLAYVIVNVSSVVNEPAYFAVGVYSEPKQPKKDKLKYTPLRGAHGSRAEIAEFLTFELRQNRLTKDGLTTLAKFLQGGSNDDYS